MVVQKTNDRHQNRTVYVGVKWWGRQSGNIKLRHPSWIVLIVLATWGARIFIHLLAVDTTHGPVEGVGGGWWDVQKGRHTRSASNDDVIRRLRWPLMLMFPRTPPPTTDSLNSTSISHPLFPPFSYRCRVVVLPTRTTIHSHIIIYSTRFGPSADAAAAPAYLTTFLPLLYFLPLPSSLSLSCGMAIECSGRNNTPYSNHPARKRRRLLRWTKKNEPPFQPPHENPSSSYIQPIILSTLDLRAYFLHYYCTGIEYAENRFVFSFGLN